MLSEVDLDEIIWTTEDGTELRVTEMEYFHLRNALKFVRKRSDEFLQASQMVGDYILAMEYTIIHTYLDCWAMVLQKELWSRSEHRSTTEVIDRWSGVEKKYSNSDKIIMLLSKGAD